MSFSFLSNISQLHGKKCLVVGDIVLDSYIFGSIERMSSEAPIPVVEVKSQKDDLGGGGNVIKNLLSFGFQVCAVSVVGNDDAGLKIMQKLDEISINSRIRISPNKTTSKKTRIIVGDKQVSRFDFETKTYEDESTMKILELDYKSALESCDIVIISDYERGVLHENFTKFIIDEARKVGKPIICDPRVKDLSKYANTTIITPNLKEASNSFGALDSNEKIHKALLALKSQYGIQKPVITLSENGIAGLDESDKMFVVPAYGDNVVDVTGAGDTVVASFAFAIANNLSQKDACTFANMAASMVIHKIGTHTTNLDEIKNKFLDKKNIYKAGEIKNSQYENYEQYLSKIVSKEQMKDIMSEHPNKKFVFTNGCFDIIHTGHLDIISRAKACGDLLILGLNSDASVKRLKGPTRPINNQQTRASVLAAIEFVDFVVLFEEDTPLETIEYLRPHTLAKGIDYIKNPQDLPGAKFVQKVEILGIKKDSTTQIIEKIIQTTK